MSIDGDRNGHKQVEDRVGIADFWEFWLLAYKSGWLWYYGNLLAVAKINVGFPPVFLI